MLWIASRAQLGGKQKVVYEFLYVLGMISHSPPKNALCVCVTGL